MRSHVLVEVDRGGFTESRHRGAVVVVDCEGDAVSWVGDSEAEVFIRSALKPFVAALVVASGAVDALGLGSDEVAVMASSHGGRDEDVENVRRILDAAGLTQDALVNPPSQPGDQSTAERLTREGAAPDRLRHMCSGEHAGMLAMIVHRGWPVEGYGAPDHPVQRAIADLVGRLFARHDGKGADQDGPAIDNCGVPTWHVPLVSIARAYAWLAQPSRLPEPLRDLEQPFTRVRDAMLRHPMHIGGPGLLDTDLSATDGKFVGKEGAEGLMGVGSLGTGMGLAVSIEDGDQTRRAANAATLSTLEHLDLLDRDELDRLRETHWKPLTDPAGHEIGEVKAIFELKPIE